MPALMLKPDRRFVEQVVATGGADLKKCFQCATCSVACDLSNGHRPFPRKEMLWAQWGLKDRLMGDPDIWLCHQCNDCSVKCPRGAKPGDVLSALRQQAVQHYAVPRFLGVWANQVKYLPVLFAVIAALLGLAILVKGPLGDALPFHHHPGFYAEFFPHWLLIGFFSFFTGLASLGALVGMVRFWGAMKEADGPGKPVAGMFAAVVKTLTAIVTHQKFGDCVDHRSRRWTHLLAFYGFVALFIVTAWAVTDMYVMPRLGVASLYPFALTHPMKILANLGALFFVAGCFKAVYDRTSGVGDSGVGSSFDWIFISVMLGVGVTGVMTEMFRFVAEASTETPWLDSYAYSIYFIHLVLVFALLVFLPYSKFAHVLWRTVALVYAARYRQQGTTFLPASPIVAGALGESGSPALDPGNQDSNRIPTND